MVKRPFINLEEKIDKVVGRCTETPAPFTFRTGSKDNQTPDYFSAR